MSEPNRADYASAWADYRKVRGTMLIAWVGPLPVLMLLIFAQDRLPFGTVIAWVAGVAWMGVFLYWNLRWVSWPCPRCGQPFISLLTPIHRQCAHCRLRIWARSDEQAPA
jgi:hypothetical protein